MIKCLVTGGAGFIGSHIVDELIDLGNQVVVIDNESSDSDKYYWNPKAINLKGDITDYVFMKEAIQGVDYIFHCAAESSIGKSIKNPLKTAEINFLGTCTVLQCARELNVKRVIYSSTSSGYGSNPIPNNEEQPDDCLNPYSVSKIAGEKLCIMYTKLFNLNTIIFRYFNVFGERSPTKGQYTPVTSTFLKQKNNGDPLTIIGDGEQSRDFIYVKDVAHINVIAAKLYLPKEKFGQVYNVGSGHQLSINQIANFISSNQVNLPPRIGEVRFSLANINKTKSTFNWHPKVSLEEWLSTKIKE